MSCDSGHDPAVLPMATPKLTGTYPTQQTFLDRGFIYTIVREPSHHIYTKWTPLSKVRVGVWYPTHPHSTK